MLPRFSFDFTSLYKGLHKFTDFRCIMLRRYMGSIVNAKLCQHCGAVFMSSSSKEKFCFPLCRERAAKERARVERVKIQKKEVAESRKKNLGAMEYLSITDAATLIGVSRPTVYKMIADGRLESVRFSNRIVRVKVSSILSPSDLCVAVRRTKPAMPCRQTAN